MTMFKAKEEIDEMAEKEFPTVHWARPMEVCSTTDKQKGYERGYTQAQKDLLDSASEGFDDCFSKYATENNLHHEFDAHFFWQACSLSYEKKIDYKSNKLKLANTRIKEKDAEIGRLEKENEKLKVNLKVCQNDYWFMINLLEKYSSNKEQAIKDCIERMKFRSPIFKQESKE